MFLAADSRRLHREVSNTIIYVSTLSVSGTTPFSIEEEEGGSEGGKRNEDTRTLFRITIENLLVLIISYLDTDFTRVLHWNSLIVNHVHQFLRR
jgi:hypothetical protein